MAAKNYISFSEFALWKKDRNEHFARYVMNHQEPPTMEMIFGSIVHEALAGKITDVEAALTKEHFTADYIRVAKELIATCPLLVDAECEKTLYVTGNRDNGLKADLLAILDGLYPKTHEVVEYKTTKNGWRTQADADEAEQLTFYCLVYYSLFNIMPHCTLVRLDTKNARITKYPTTRTLEQVLTMKDQVNEMQEDLVKKGWWTGRRSSR